MNTPIADFVKEYAKSNVSRFHMPGHKGKSFIGCEKYDITEIPGADVLDCADGIILESENNASLLFKTAHTYYSTGGSTTAICAMLALVRDRKRPLILAARNVHKAFVHACALLDYDVQWMLSDNYSSLMECEIRGEVVEKHILSLTERPSAVYLTSPDYLGNIQRIPDIANVCKKYNIPLLVDNAHGAYLAFMEKSLHPIHLGATVCCDSAHKTLPVLTGGAYLHISREAPGYFNERARKSLSLFSTTSPSYLILQSLDLCNRYLDESFRRELALCAENVSKLEEYIRSRGIKVKTGEPLKVTVHASESGYTGSEIAGHLRKYNAEAEFFDEEFVVMMFTPQNTQEDFEVLKEAFSKLSPKAAIRRKPIGFTLPKQKISLREAIFSESETLCVDLCEGRICAAPAVSCPPAVPPAISGEVITKEMIELFSFCGIDKISVVKK